MAITTAVAAVASVGVSAYGAYNTNKNAKKAQRIGDAQSDRQSFFANDLMDLMKNPSKIFDDPGYKELFDQGTMAVNRSNALQGFTGSGNAAIELQSFGQNFSSKYLRDQESLLASLSGAQFNPAAAYGTAGQGYDDSFKQFGSALASLGYTAGGFGGGGSAGASSGGGTAYTPNPEGGFNNGGGYIVNLPGD